MCRSLAILTLKATVAVELPCSRMTESEVCLMGMLKICRESSVRKEGGRTNSGPLSPSTNLGRSSNS